MGSATTQGWLVGGRVRHDQLSHGHRTGIEPVLLAASIPARAGERVLEGGTGSGAALLCLANRVPGIFGLGIELDPAMAALARENIAANGRERLHVTVADLNEWRSADVFDHAFANPPWHAAAGTVSMDDRRELARRGTPDLLDQWVKSLAKPLRFRGTLTLIIGASVLPHALQACSRAGCGSPTLYPFWPRPGRAAKLVLLRTIKGGAAHCRVLAGQVLHATSGKYTPRIEAILRDGEGLALDHASPDQT